MAAQDQHHQLLVQALLTLAAAGEELGQALRERVEQAAARPVVWVLI
jgi:hypothetical protein